MCVCCVVFGLYFLKNLYRLWLLNLNEEAIQGVKLCASHFIFEHKVKIQGSSRSSSFNSNMKTTPLLLLLGLALVACTQHGNEHNDAMLKKVVDTDAEDIDDSSMEEQATRLDSFLEVKNGAKNGVLRGQSQQEKRRLTRARKRGRARGRRGSSHVDTTTDPCKNPAIFCN